MIQLLIILGLIVFSGASLFSIAAVGLSNSIVEEIPLPPIAIRQPSAVSAPDVLPAVSLNPEEQALLDSINDYRRQFGAGELSVHPALQEAARTRVVCYQRHGINRRHRACGREIDQDTRYYGYQGNMVGENTGQGYVDTNACVFKGWHNSYGHRKAQQSRKWDWIGVGVRGNTYVTIYGS